MPALNGSFPVECNWIRPQTAKTAALITAWKTGRVWVLLRNDSSKLYSKGKIRSWCKSIQLNWLLKSYISVYKLLVWLKHFLTRF